MIFTIKMRDNEGFKLVIHRKKRAPRANCPSNLTPLDNERNVDSNITCETLAGRLHEAEVELKNSLFLDNVFHYLKDSLNALNVKGIPDILCYGLGQFSSRRSSKYQLALLLCLKKHYDSQVYVYDPVFSSVEIELLGRFGCNVINVNEEGKRKIRENTTLVYMPHCSVHLINNFLYANWCGERLNKCILLTNSFSIVADSAKRTNKANSIDYILRIQPYISETVLTNDFAHEEAFNDLNIHTFLKQRISALPKSFWDERKEPCYRDAETEYLTAKQTERIDAKCRE